MQPTLPPWAWVTWERRARTRAGGRLASRTRDDQFAIYGIGTSKDNAHIIRLDRLGKSLLLNRPWMATSGPFTWHFDRFDKTQPWNMHDVKSFQPVISQVAVSPAVQKGGAAYAARGWAVAAVALAIFVMIVRVTENCLKSMLRTHLVKRHSDRGLSRYGPRGEPPRGGEVVRRQESDEWCTPNVTATCPQHNVEIGSLPRLDDTDGFVERIVNRDLPPPYCECPARPPYTDDEPPPPYATCYVSYTDLPQELPIVQVHNRRRQNILLDRAFCGIHIDNVQNDLIENGIRTLSTGPDNTGDLDPGVRTELVFANGRVLERIPENVHCETASSDEGEPSHDNIMYVDATAPANATANRVLHV